MSQPKTVLDYCKHCGDKQNLEILSEVSKRVDWLPPDIDHLSIDELQELGSVPFSAFEWQVLFCPNCNKINIVQRHAYSEFFDYEYDNTGMPNKQIWNWENETLYPQNHLDVLLNRVQDRDVRSDIDRGLSKLTLDEVDLGLFILGRAFDVMSKRYFIALAKNGKISTSKGGVMSGEDAKSNNFNLSTRINLFIKNGILEDKKPLHFLRDERNDPAHNIASFAQRRELLASAAIYANWYLEYIILFEEGIAILPM